jgi:hypothetical protein
MGVARTSHGFGPGSINSVLSARVRSRSGSAYFGFLAAGFTLRNSLAHL